MDGLRYVDIFATKGLEYVLVLAFLPMFVVVWRFLRAPAASPVASGRPLSANDWFRLEEGRYYHQGHTWALPERDGIFRVGLDDFAQKLLGSPSRIDVPEVGSHVEQGGEGWRVVVGSKPVPMLSPVAGEVVEVNRAVLESPQTIDRDPYQGWLMKVRVPNVKPALRSLLSEDLARAWMDQTVDALRRKMAGNLGMVLQDGGQPVPGFVRQLSPDDWEAIAEEFLRTN